MNNWLNVIGLLLDIIGVVGLYYVKVKLPEPPEFSGNDSNMIRLLGRSLTMAKRGNKSADKKADIFFVIILLGFLFQLSSAILSFSHNPANEPRDKTESNQTCN